jgi:uncharacterized protein with PIN domain
MQTGVPAPKILFKVFMKEMALSDLKFTLDVHLGKLARSLRLLGFDSYWDASFNDKEIIIFSLSEGRIILTRDKELLENKNVIHGYRVLSQKPDDQLREVFIHFDLKDHIKPFSRCMECNSILKEARKEDISERLFPKTREYYNSFIMCTGCGRIYWEGSHYERMKKYIESVIKDVN